MKFLAGSCLLHVLPYTSRLGCNLLKKPCVVGCARLFVLLLAFLLTRGSFAGAVEMPVFFSDDKEIELGRTISSELERWAVWSFFADRQERVRKVASRLLPAVTRKKLPWKITEIEYEVPNALAVPGGRIFITSGLCSHFKGDEELIAGVIAHEIAHIDRFHAVKALQARLAISVGLALLGKLIEEKAPDYLGLLKDAGGLSVVLGSLKYSRTQEEEADKYALKLLHRSGFTPRIMLRVMESLKSLDNGKSTDVLASLLSTHPTPEDRRMYILREILAMQFRGEMSPDSLVEFALPDNARPFKFSESIQTEHAIVKAVEFQIMPDGMISFKGSLKNETDKKAPVKFRVAIFNRRSEELWSGQFSRWFDLKPGVSDEETLKFEPFQNFPAEKLPGLDPIPAWIIIE